MRIRLKTAALLAVLAGIAGFVAVDAANDEREPVAAVERPAQAAPSEPASEPPQAAAAPSQQPGFTVLERPGLTASGNPLFESQTWQPPPPPPGEAAKAAPPPPPSAPPLPYRFAGRLIHDGRLSLLLSKGDSVVPIKEGETLDGLYKVESITDRQITLVYLPLNQKQTIPVLTGLAEAPPAGGGTGASSPLGMAASGGASGRAVPPPLPTGSVVGPQTQSGPGTPATVAWTGPQQVKVGMNFEVKLRVSSSQPLHAWPMQLRVDPEHFQVLTVKPGRLPGASDPTFSYRLNADGSIFVGASVQQPTAGSDAEIVSLTLRPMKTASSAEVSIASLNLQGAAGRPIPYAQVAAFRTTITP